LRRTGSAFGRVFEPSPVHRASGFVNPPRPFVFRAAHLDQAHIHAGSKFYFDVNVFDTRDDVVVRSIIMAFTELAEDGLGARRSRTELNDVWQLNESGEITTASPFGEPLRLSLAPPPGPVSRLVVRFITPTELKSEEGIASVPDFAILAARVRDRISTLSELYGDGPLQIDFAGFAERASRVRIVRSNLHHVSASRRSSRTGQTHPLGGFVGDVEYEGDLREFVPYVRAAQWTGVGRQTVWGKGQISVSEIRV